MKNSEETFKKDLEHLYSNTEGRFVDMYDSEPVHAINKQLELHLGRKIDSSDTEELDVEKLPGSSLLYAVKYKGEDLGILSISRDRHNYQLLTHFNKT